MVEVDAPASVSYRSVDTSRSKVFRENPERDSMTKYSDREKGEALTLLQSNGGNVKQTAAQLDMPLVTLWEWAKGRVHPDVTTLKEGMKIELAERMEKLAESCLNLLTPEKLENSTAAQLATITGIAIDKMRLLREQATTISNAAITDEERLRELQELMQRLRQRQLEAQQGQEAEPELPQ